MKKFLLSMMAVLSLGYASAETYTYTGAEISGLTATGPVTECYVGGFKFTFDKNDGGTAPAFNKAGDIRLYVKNSATIAANGANITSIEFTISAQGLKRWAELSASTGTVTANVEAKTATWTGSTAELTLTVTGNNKYGTETDNAAQFDFSAVTFTTDGPVSEFDIPEPPTESMAEYKLATAIATGKFAIACNDTVIAALDATKTYGYLYGETATIADGALTAPLATTLTFTEVAGKGYTIQDREGRYYYMTGTFNSFNVSTEVPDSGAYWNVTLGENSVVTIVNIDKQKTMMYSTKFHSLGAYPEKTDEHVLPTLYSWVKDTEGTTPDDPKPQTTSVTALSQLASLAKNTKITMDLDLTVVYVNGAYVYVYDGTNYGLIYKSGLGVEAGQVIAKGWSAVVDVFNNLIEIKPDDATLATSGTAVVPSPAVVEADEVSTMLTASNQNVYVQINDVVFAEATPAADETDNTKRNFIGTADGTEINFYQRFEVPSVEPGTYAVMGFISVYKETVQVYPIAFADMAGIKGIEAAEAPAAYYSIQGVKVANPVSGQLYIRVQSGKATKVVF